MNSFKKLSFLFLRVCGVLHYTNLNFDLLKITYGGHIPCLITHLLIFLKCGVNILLQTEYQNDRP